MTEVILKEIIENLITRAMVDKMLKLKKFWNPGQILRKKYFFFFNLSHHKYFILDL